MTSHPYKFLTAVFKFFANHFGLLLLGNVSTYNSKPCTYLERSHRKNFWMGGKIWIRIFPDKPITKKPAETRMGKGKGSPEDWVAVIKPGKILYEMEGVSEAVAREAFRLAARKLPLGTKFLTREVL